MINHEVVGKDVNEVHDVYLYEQMAATIAHEVKNPLSVVLAHLEIIKAKDVEGIYTKNILIMDRCLNQVNELMIQFAKMTTIEDKYEEINISCLILLLVENLLEAYAKSIKFDLVCDKEIKLVCKPKRLETAISNILKNSIESIQEANVKGEICINIKNIDSDVVISIADNGKGLGEQSFNDVIKPHYTTKEKGNGIGLKICNDAILEHNGKLILENRTDKKGCVVTVTLPKEELSNMIV